MGVLLLHGVALLAAHLERQQQHGILIQVDGVDVDCVVIGVDFRGALVVHLELVHQLTMQQTLELALEGHAELVDRAPELLEGLRRHLLLVVEVVVAVRVEAHQHLQTLGQLREGLMFGRAHPFR